MVPRGQGKQDSKPKVDQDLVVIQKKTIDPELSVTLKGAEEPDESRLVQMQEDTKVDSKP